MLPISPSIIVRMVYKLLNPTAFWYSLFFSYNACNVFFPCACNIFACLLSCYATNVQFNFLDFAIKPRKIESLSLPYICSPLHTTYRCIPYISLLTALLLKCHHILFVGRYYDMVYHSYNLLNISYAPSMLLSIFLVLSHLTWVTPFI